MKKCWVKNYELKDSNKGNKPICSDLIFAYSDMLLIGWKLCFSMEKIAAEVRFY